MNNTIYSLNVSNNDVVVSAKYNLSGNLYSTTNFLPEIIKLSPDINESLQFITWETDDWGGRSDARPVFPNTSLQEKYRALGTDYADLTSAWSNVTLENASDVETFLNFWDEYENSTGRKIYLTPIFTMNEPDYDAIRTNDFTSFVVTNLSAGVTWERPGLTDKYIEGYQEGTWLPQYHATTHINYRIWMEQLRLNDTVAHTLFLLIQATQSHSCLYYNY